MSAVPALPGGALAPSVPLVLDATGIRVSFPRDGKAPVTVIDGVGLGLERGQVTVLLGESGSGKTVFARAITGLAAPTAIVTGSAMFDGTDLVGGSRSELRALHGDRIGVVPQDPNASLDPMRRIGAQIVETLLQHRQVASRSEAKARSIALLEQVQIRDPHRVVRCYPHEVSGGMRQRIAIAIAVCCGPS